MKYKLSSLLLALMFFSCETDKSQEAKSLTKLSGESTVALVKSGNFDYSYAKFVNKDGSELSDKERGLLNQGKMAKDFYVNDENVIKEVRIRPVQLRDKFIEIQRRDLALNAVDKVELVEIDCSQLDSIYAEVARTDQEVRTGDASDMFTVDKRNQQVVISAIKNCGWTEDYLQTIWIVFQHSPPGIMTYYYPTLKKYSEKGLLDKSKIALMEDRMLMRHGYKQIYGSQISGGNLYNLEDPDSVNIRRATMDLQPIEEYLTHWGLNFEEEIAQMKKK